MVKQEKKKHYKAGLANGKLYPGKPYDRLVTCPGWSPAPHLMSAGIGSTPLRPSAAWLTDERNVPFPL